MKLYVDDLRACPEGWELARTVTSAIRMLAQFSVEEVSLDHDISHYVSTDSSIVKPVACSETFEAVAWFIAAMPQDLKPKVKFHTANPEGERIMRVILERAYIFGEGYFGEV